MSPHGAEQESCKLLLFVREGKGRTAILAAAAHSRMCMYMPLCQCQRNEDRPRSTACFVIESPMAMAISISPSPSLSLAHRYRSQSQQFVSSLHLKIHLRQQPAREAASEALKQRLVLSRPSAPPPPLHSTSPLPALARLLINGGHCMVGAIHAHQCLHPPPGRPAPIYLLIQADRALASNPAPAGPLHPSPSPSATHPAPLLLTPMPAAGQLRPRDP